MSHVGPVTWRAQLGVLLVVMGSSCASEDEGRRSIDIGDYDTSCTAAAECVPARVGYMCPCRTCANAAINISSQSAYAADFADIECPGSTVQCGPCPAPPPTDCVDGTCVLLK